MWGARGGEWGSRTPVELRETREFNWRTEFGLPILQAIAIAVTFAYALLVAPFIAVLSAGLAVFWLFTGICMTATFMWFLWRCGNLVTEDRKPIVEQFDDQVCNSLMWMEAASGVIMSLMVGGIALCFHKVLVYIEFVPPFWLRWVIEGNGRLLGIAQLPMALVLAAFVLLAFGQELWQRSPFQEMHVWEALGEIIKSFGLQSARAWVYDPPIINHRRNSDRDKSPSVARRQARTPGEIQTAALVEFIRRGQKIGYTRAVWAESGGTVLEATGAKMTSKMWVEFTQGLERANIMSKVAGKTNLICSVEEALAHVSHPSFNL
jgi:hypothetical protein